MALLCHECESTYTHTHLFVKCLPFNSNRVICLLFAFSLNSYVQGFAILIDKGIRYGEYQYKYI